MSPEDVAFFLKFHHDMGEFLHFPEKNLGDFVIVDTKWLVDIFMTLISPLEFLRKKNMKNKTLRQLKRGKVSEKSLHKIWKGYEISFLFELMNKIDLIIPLEMDQGSSSESTGEEGSSNKLYLVSCTLPPIDREKSELQHFEWQRMVKVYTSIHRSNDYLPIGTFHTFLSKCSKIPSWNLCHSDYIHSTGAFFEIESDSHLRLAVILLSYMGITTIETSIWCTKGIINKDTITEDVIQDIMDIRRALHKELNAVHIRPSPEFQLLCPNWNSDCNEKCLVTVTKEKCAETRRAIYRPQADRCKTKGATWKSDTYKGTAFGKEPHRLKNTLQQFLFLCFVTLFLNSKTK